MVKDNLNRGVSKELLLIDFIKQTCKLNVYKNPDPFDIDLVIYLRSGRKILLEIEETSKRNWPEDKQKPQTPSLLFTMPLRKIKYFIRNGHILSDYLRKNSSINSIEEFNFLYPENKFESRSDCIRIYIKGSYNLAKLCVVRNEVIVKSLNNELVDQQKVNQRISEIKRWNSRWRFKGNIWENTSVKNYDEVIREDPLLLILGHVEFSPDLVWIDKKEIYDKVLGKYE